MFPLACDGNICWTLIGLFGLAIIFAAMNVVSLILAATAVDQGVFVPLKTCATLVINAVCAAASQQWG